jgi:hypothetical protein
MSPIPGVVIGKDKIRLNTGTILTIGGLNELIGTQVQVGFNYGTMKGMIVEEEQYQEAIYLWDYITHEENLFSFPAL